jgi:unsaturated chondroitin disaccharide hydrolase
LIHFAVGYADWSTWSRGQAWAVHGFTIAYRYTNYQPFLDKAVGAANYFLGHLPSSIDLIPYWDFDAPHNSTIAYQPRDTSAATIFSSALVELSQQVTEPDLRDKFLSSAKAIVDQLLTPTYLILGNKDYVLRAIMANGTHGPYPEKPYDVATVFGDFYLTQTVLRLMKLGSLF